MGVESVSLMHTDEQTRATLDIIRGSAQRGAGIVRQVLRFARGLGEKKGEIQARHILREIEQILTRTFPEVDRDHHPHPPGPLVHPGTAHSCIRSC